MSTKNERGQPAIAAIYARYSSSAQNDASIEQQVEECRAYARQNNLAVVQVYEDRAMTGRNDRRPGFQRMIRAAERGEFQTLLTYKSNRLARNMLDALKYEERLSKAGVSVIYCKEDFGNNAAGRLALRMMMSINEFYSDNLAEDIRRGMQDSAAKCKVVCKIPYGYQKAADGTMELNPDTAPIVAEIFSKYVSGVGTSQIARELNARGVRTAKGGAWNKSSFRELLVNERYTGVYIYGGIRVEGGMPAIIDRETFDMARMIAARQPMRGRRRSDADYLLTGKLFCGECLCPMVGMSGHSGNGDVYNYYCCQGKRARNGCTSKNVRKEYIEAEVTRAVINTVITDDLVQWIADAIMEAAQIKNDASRAAYLEKRMAETKKQISNIVRAVEMGVIYDEFRERMDALQAEKAALTAQLAEAKAERFDYTRDDVIAYLEHIRACDPTDKKAQKMIIRDFVEAVYLYDDHFKLRVTYTKDKNVFEIPYTPPTRGDVFALGAECSTTRRLNEQCRIVKTSTGFMVICSIER